MEKYEAILPPPARRIIIHIAISVLYLRCHCRSRKRAVFSLAKCTDFNVKYVKLSESPYRRYSIPTQRRAESIDDSVVAIGLDD